MVFPRGCATLRVVATAVEPKPQGTIRVRIICSHCDRVVTRTSRKGYTVRCPHCGTVNAGPALVAEQGKPKAEGSRRRVTRRARAAEQREEREAVAADRPVGTHASTGTAPAPRAAKVTRPATPKPAPKPKSAPERASAHTGPKPKGGVLAALERLTWGGGEDG